MDEEDRELLAAALTALREFGMHKYMCASRTRMPSDPLKYQKCDCGLSSVTKRLAGYVKDDDRREERGE